MAGNQQDLMPCGGVEQQAFHLRQACLVAVDQSVVEDDERGVTGFLEQVGVGQTASRRCAAAWSILPPWQCNLIMIVDVGRFD